MVDYISFRIRFHAAPLWLRLLCKVDGVTHRLAQWGERRWRTRLIRLIEREEGSR